MGDGVTVAKTSRLGEGDEDVIIEHFVCMLGHHELTGGLEFTIFLDDVVHTVVTSLSTISRTQRRAAFGSIFLINNIAHLRTHLLINPKNDVDNLLSGPTREIINSNFRTAKAGYFDSNFSPLVQALAEDKDKGKSATKEKFTRFFDLLDEIVERHSFAKVLPEEEDLRETIADEVNKLVVPVFQRFTQRNTGKDFSKSKPHDELFDPCCIIANIMAAPPRSTEMSVPHVDRLIKYVLMGLLPCRYQDVRARA
jgi:exocyst complex component 7